MAHEDQHILDFIQRVNQLFTISPPARLSGFDADFQNLKRVSAGLKQSKDHETLVGQRPENKKKNRYKDILPFDSTRVKINKDPDSDYINACFVKGSAGHLNYIASQGPLPNTVDDFWQMLWQYNIRVIIMVCREIELGKKKCERYWADQDIPKKFDDITVTLSDRKNLKDGYCLRTIKAEKGNETRYIKQFHYTSWPDHGVPKTCYDIITLINHIRDEQSYGMDEDAPLCVHCSAGCGRTGAVLAIDYVRNLLSDKRVPAGLNTYDIIAEMRRQRPAIVQTKDQYEFVNTAISEMFRTYLQTRSVSYKDFNDGLKQEAYVNINISHSTPRNGSLEKNVKSGSQRQSTPNYENVNIILEQKNKTNTNSFDFPDAVPPPKPSREASIPGKTRPRPVSILGQPYQNVNDRKKSAPAVSFGNEARERTASQGHVSKPKPRSQNALSNFDSRSPVMQTQPTSPVTPVTPVVVMKPKPPISRPEHAQKKNTANAPPKPPGKPTNPVASLHGKTLFSSQSTQPDFSSQLISSKSTAPPKINQPLFPMKLDSKEKPLPVNSPVLNKVHLFEKTKTKPVVAKVPIVRPKTPETVLHISEENDNLGINPRRTLDSKENDHFVKSNKSAPNVMPKPKLTAKLMIQELDAKNATSKSNNTKFHHTGHVPMRAALKPKMNIRPVSQNVIISSTGTGDKNHLSHSGNSTSVFDLTDSRKTSPFVPFRPRIVRSSSVSGGNSRTEKQFTETVKKNSEDTVLKKVDVKTISINPIGHTQADSSYGKAFFATTKSKFTKPEIDAPMPFKLRITNFGKSDSPNGAQCAVNDKINRRKHSIESVDEIPPSISTIKLNTHVHHYNNIDVKHKENITQNSDELTTATASPEYVNTEMGAPETSDTHGYVNTEFGMLVNSPTTITEIKQENYAHDIVSCNKSAMIAKSPPPTPSSKNKPNKLNVNTMKILENNLGISPVHGSVSPTKDEVASKPSLSSKPIDDVRKRAPPKPQRSFRRENSAKDDGTANKSHVNLQKYEKKNVYNEVSFSNNPDDDYAVLDDTIRAPKTSSNASLSLSSNHTTAPPKLPTRTAESHIFLDEGPPPDLPTRTEDSYLTLEDGRQQIYEVVEQTNFQLPSPGSSNSDAGRRPSGNVTSHPSLGTSAIAAKAKDMLEKTGNVISKVGASFAKSMDDDTSTPPPTTIEGRSPTYAPEPVIYSGQDLSFGKRIAKKIRGPRNLPH